MEPFVQSTEIPKSKLLIFEDCSYPSYLLDHCRTFCWYANPLDAEVLTDLTNASKILVNVLVKDTGFGWEKRTQIIVL